ncbi:MAG: HIT domain-containing protein [Acidimicrobiaceae bacterium]|nr:HIT domain-containing protein [Acidimicrobiaceae bacterium]
MECLWAGWRIPAMRADRATVEESHLTSSGTAATTQKSDQTLFDAILASGLPDDQTYIVWCSELVCVLLNRYPYTVGHVLVIPCRAVDQLEDLDQTEYIALWEAVQHSVIAIKTAFSPDGINLGANIGKGAGPSVTNHLHIHVVPRWKSDTNFMSAVANVRVLPRTLQDTWKSLRESWPTDATVN